MIQFWINEPTVLFNNEHITELWPTATMSYEQKLNAVTRFIILISCLGYLFSSNVRIPVAGALTIVCIIVLFKMKRVEGFSQHKPFSSLSQSSLSQSLAPLQSLPLQSATQIINTEFKEGTKKNPFSNVLLTEITDDPDRKSAPPAFHPVVDETITKNVKKAVQRMNPEIKNTGKQFYGDLKTNFDLDQSNHAFFSMPNTRIENDQGAFSKYLYGNMPSSKDSDAAGAMQRVANTNRYTLY